MSQVESFAKLKIEADTSDLQKAGREIDATKKKVEDLGKGSKDSGADLSDLGKAAGGAGGEISALATAGGLAVVGIAAIATAATTAGGILATLAKNAIEAGDEFNDLAGRTNIAVERLYVLKSVYDSTGASLEDVLSNSEKLSSRLAKQDEETGKVVKAIDALGVSLKDANGEQKSSLQLQQDIVEAADKAQDKQKAQALAVAALGAEYYKLRKPIMDAKESQEEMYDLLYKTGGLMTGNLAKASDEFNDKLNAINKVFAGIGNTIASVALPALTKVAEKVLEVTTVVAQAIARITGMNPATDKVNNALADLNKQKDNAEAAIARIEGTEYANTAQGAKALAQAKDRVSVLQDQIREMNRYKTAADSAAEAEKKLTLGGAPGEGNGTVSGVGTKPSKEKKEKKAKGLTDEQIYKKQQDAYDELLKQQKEFDDYDKKWNESNKRKAEGFRELIDVNKQYRDAIGEVNELERLGFLQAEEAEKARKKLKDGMINDAETFAAGWENAFKDFEKYATNSANAGSEAFNSMARGVEGALDKFIETGKFSFSDFARSIIADLGKIAAKQAATGIMKLFSGGSSGGGIDWGSIGSSVAGWFSGLGFAGGGDPPVGKASLVGEKGPELFVPKTAGTIIPNSQTFGGGSTQNNNISINISGAKDADETGRVVSREIEKLMRGIAKQEMASGLRRGNMLNP